MKTKAEINKEFTDRYRKHNLENSSKIYSDENLETFKSCSSCKLSLPRKLFGKNITGKDGFSNRCKPCANTRNRHLYNQDSSRADIKKQYRQENPEIYRKASLKYYHNNSDTQNANNKKWLSENTWYVNAQSAKKRASKKQAMPKWVDRKKIAKFYKLARELTKQTGLQHHVDHIIPLVNEEVCGLHIPSNLRIITAIENMQKSNNFSQELYEQILSQNC